MSPWREEAGFTLVELLLSMVIGLVVLGVAAGIMVTALQSQPRAAAQASAVQGARTSMERMVRELRQGTRVTSASASQISIITYVPQSSCGGSQASTAILCLVSYSCVSGSCSRAVGPPSGGSTGPSSIVLKGLSSNNIFTYAPSGGACTSPSATSPTSVCVTLAFPGRRGENAITLTDGVVLRNA